MTKSRVAGLMLVLGVGFLILRSGNEPSDVRDQGSGSESATERQFQPREPAFLKPEHDFGIADRSDTRSAPPPYDYPNAYSGEYAPQAYPDAYRTPTWHDGQPRYSTNGNGFRFRPLGDKERQRIRAGYPDQYPPAYYSSPETAPRPSAPPAHATRPAYRQPQQNSYSFRPLNKSQPARDRWQGPYRRPGWSPDPTPIDPWNAPPDPQWGSTPPAQRMYPNLNQSSSRRLTAR